MDVLLFWAIVRVLWRTMAKIGRTVRPWLGEQTVYVVSGLYKLLQAVLGC
jgi:hypothetical protein